MVRVEVKVGRFWLELAQQFETYDAARAAIKAWKAQGITVRLQKGV